MRPLEGIEDGIRLQRLPTRLALNKTVGSVKLDHPSRRMAGQLMKAVDVLGDKGLELPPSVELRQGPMGHIGLGIPELPPAFHFEFPVLRTS